MTEYMQQHGATAEEIAQAQLALNQGQGFEGPQPANEFVKAWGAFMAGEITALGFAALIGKAASWFTNGSKATSAVEDTAGSIGNVVSESGRPLSGPTENWKTFLNAEKQIQLELGSNQRVDQIISETLSGKKNFTSSMTLTADEALLAGQKYLGGQYTEIGKPGSGVFHSADGVREVRIDPGSLSGSHAPGVPHVHFGVKDPLTGKYIANNHVPYVE